MTISLIYIYSMLYICKIDQRLVFVDLEIPIRRSIPLYKIVTSTYQINNKSFEDKGSIIYLYIGLKYIYSMVEGPCM